MDEEPCPFVDFEDLQTLTLKYSDQLSEGAKVGVRVDLTILAQVHATARISIKFHNLKTINHYKHAAHIAFWFQKFKPLRFIEPLDVRTVIRSAAENIETFIYGDSAKFEADFDITQQDYVAAKEDPINEWVAFLLAKTIIRSAQDKIVTKESENPAVREALSNAVVAVHRKFEDQNEIDEIVHGIRYHNYSARGFATMIETMFKVPGA